MAANTFQFRLITPQGKVVDSQASSAVIPAHDGLLGIRPGRAAIVAKLGIGPLKVDIAGESKPQRFLIEDGFAQMVSNKLTVLTTKATAAADLTETDAQAELTAVESRKTTPGNRAEATKQRSDKLRAKQKVRIAREFKSRG